MFFGFYFLELFNKYSLHSLFRRIFTWIFNFPLKFQTDLNTNFFVFLTISIELKNIQGFEILVILIIQGNLMNNFILNFSRIRQNRWGAFRSLLKTSWEIYVKINEGCLYRGICFKIIRACVFRGDVNSTWGIRSKIVYNYTIFMRFF